MKILRGELLLLYTCNIIKSLLFRPHLTPDQLHNLNNGEIILTHYSRYQKIEDERQKREHKFRLQQLELENERRREDREHELNILRMLTSSGLNMQPAPTYSNTDSIITDQSSLTYFKL